MKECGSEISVNEFHRIDSFFSKPSSISAQNDPPVFFYIGLHKSGSTWLKERFIQPANGNGLIFCNDHARSHKAFILPDIGNFDVAEARQQYADQIEAAKRSRSPLVVRDEALGALPYGQRFSREVVAMRIKAAFPHSKIIVSIREQRSLILSLYGHYVRGGGTLRLVNFVNRQASEFHPTFIRFEDYDFNRLLLFYESLFGIGNVLLLPLEWSKSNVPDVSAKLSEFIGAPIPESDESSAQKPANPGWNWAATEAGRIANRYYPKEGESARRPGAFKRKFAPNSIAYQVNRLTGGSKSGKGFSKAKDIIRDAIGDYYAESNTLVGKRIGIDLASLGYDCRS